MQQPLHVCKCHPHLLAFVVFSYITCCWVSIAHISGLKPLHQSGVTQLIWAVIFWSFSSSSQISSPRGFRTTWLIMWLPHWNKSRTSSALIKQLPYLGHFIQLDLSKTSRSSVGSSFPRASGVYSSERTGQAVFDEAPLSSWIPCDHRSRRSLLVAIDSRSVCCTPLRVSQPHQNNCCSGLWSSLSDVCQHFPEDLWPKSEGLKVAEVSC